MRTITGTVTSTKMDKTIVVSVDTYKSHPKYHKKYKVTKKLETRPTSKLKRWAVQAA